LVFTPTCHLPDWYILAKCQCVKCKHHEVNSVLLCFLFLFTGHQSCYFIIVQNDFTVKMTRDITSIFHSNWTNYTELLTLFLMLYNVLNNLQKIKHNGHFIIHNRGVVLKYKITFSATLSFDMVCIRSSIMFYFTHKPEVDKRSKTRDIAYISWHTIPNEVMAIGNNIIFLKVY